MADADCHELSDDKRVKIATEEGVVVCTLESYKSITDSLDREYLTSDETRALYEALGRYYDE